MQVVIQTQQDDQIVFSNILNVIGTSEGLQLKFYKHDYPVGEIMSKLGEVDYAVDYDDRYNAILTIFTKDIKGYMAYGK